MTDQVMDLIRKPIRDVRPTATLRQTAVELSEEQVGALIVRDHRGTLGVVSEHDLARALAEGVDPDDDRVEDVMTYELITTAGSTSPRAAADAMAKQGIRHLLVVDGDDEPLGVISARDLLGVLGTPTPPDPGS